MRSASSQHALVIRYFVSGPVCRPAARQSSCAMRLPVMLRLVEPLPAFAALDMRHFVQAICRGSFSPTCRLGRTAGHHVPLALFHPERRNRPANQGVPPARPVFARCRYPSASHAPHVHLLQVAALPAPRLEGSPEGEIPTSGRYGSYRKLDLVQLATALGCPQSAQAPVNNFETLADRRIGGCGLTIPSPAPN